MQCFQRILLYADPNAIVEPSLYYAMHLAAHHGATVTVADCVDEPARRDRLEAIADRLRTAGIAVSLLALGARPADEISLEAHAGRVDLVIKTAVGVGEQKERALFGTTATRLMRNCPCPVCIVDPAEDRRFDRIVAAVDPIAADPEHRELNQKILDVAVALAEQAGGELDVLHAWTAFGESVLSARMDSDQIAAHMEKSREYAESRLARLVVPLGRRIAAEHIHLYHGDPDRVLANFVRQRNSDLIVMGTIGRSGLPALLTGNTAERVMHRVQCSVLAIKPGSFSLSPRALGCGHSPATEHEQSAQDATTAASYRLAHPTA